ncbi:heme lyase CcmF/NrfE family subunit [Capillimicrobium parvum]|uniref:Cytochrome c-type biogenesis protein CcmF n=1 Tax=Capillimicrobium parvum TaxID=2884022 RepID=A0A9E6XVN1_9ACTN|nr:heme lyase CcmF/NrfE family subunit [Capillimicrobium parvum]UGS35261.1 Cytochrome c-type biogenesis protein CcmF [Capillimicrobium parvum]
MAIVGRAALIIALGVCAYGMFAALYGVRTGRREWVDSARRSVYALAALLTVAFAVLEIAFLRSDFHFVTVAQHSSTTTPTFYKAAAVWSSQEGSLLLWVWLLSLWSSLVLFMTRRRMRDVVPWATTVLLGYGAFFCVLLVFKVTPFETVVAAPPEGVGLNPLLRHPSMMIHPPMLYSGYTLFAIPFAFAVGALIARRVDAEWIRSTRRFALAAWLFLGIGILLGARWSYAELGWGGYWAWDPVENASLMPWLIGTAFLHSVMIQEKRGMLKIWNVSLVLATGTLCVLGTFLVRSGILNSIHAFGASTLGIPFVVLICGMALGSIALVIWRRDVLRSEHRLDSLFSREAVFLLNNIVLVALCFVVFWGTFFPLISEAVTGNETSVGPPWFNRYTVPLALVLVLLSGIGPLIAWRRATVANLRRTFTVPVLCGLVALVALLPVGGVPQKPLALAMFALAAFVAGTVGQEIFRGVRARRAMSHEPVPMAFVSLVRRNRRRYGGYFVHLGIAILFVGVAGSSAFQVARDITLKPGQSARVDGYDVRYVQATGTASDPQDTGAALVLGAVLQVSKDGKVVTTLRPSRGYYPAMNPTMPPVQRLVSGEGESEIGLDAGVTHDLWSAVSPDLTWVMKAVGGADRFIASPQGEGLTTAAALQGIALAYERQPPATTFRVINSPLVFWIWAGSLIVFSGGLIALWPAPDAARRRATAGLKARVAQDLGQA